MRAFNTRLFALCLMFLAASLAQAAEKIDSIYKRTLKGTAQVQTPKGTGTGWIVDAEKKWLITAEHVVGDESQVKVLFPAYRDGRAIEERDFYEKAKSAVVGRVLRVDADRDLALIELDELPEGVVQLKLADESPEPGETVHAVGCPGYSSALWVYSQGPVRQTAKIRLNAGVAGSGPRLIESQIPLNPGDSGGPLVNNAGELVGVNHAIHLDARLVSFSIEVSELRHFLAAKKSNGKKQQVEDVMKKARKAIEEKEWADAEKQLRSVLEIDPRNVEAWHRLAWMMNETKKHEEAIVAALIAVRLNDKCAEAWTELGYACKELKKWEKAALALKLAIECDPKNGKAYDYLAEVLKEMDEPEAADEVLRRKKERAE